ncbi:serine/threonine-protein kinase [Streptomyces sp. NBC_01190]|uniref:serine/threonine-protein kinase n=1 Tax=Streptomyces sp. NBC_01190 TaxID=2903767 RepID=UPI0038682405|nr:serine/threonine protein kinase [Streptomyces sp. NBC_01190]
MASDGGETAPGSPPRDMVADRYRITGRLGRGGMGTVWQATDELLRRQVAVKELHLPDTGLSARQAALRRERALREARTAALIRHPHVVVVHDVVEHQGHPWIVMELVDGLSLAHLLDKDGPLPPREAARVGAAVAGALRAAHASDIQHRDVKPANVLVEHGTGRVVLTDFGIARLPGSGTISETGAFIGSPEYTAPERMSGRGTGPASDLWSLGALLCAAVHGESPFHRDSIGEIVHAVAIDAFVPPEELGPLLPVVLRLLDRDPERRMGSAEAQRLLASLAETGAEPVVAAVELPLSTPETTEPDAAPEAAPEADAERTPDGSPSRRRESTGDAVGNVSGNAVGGEIEAVAGRPVVPGAPGRPSSRARGVRDARSRGGIQMIAVGALVVIAVSAGAGATYLVSRHSSGDGRTPTAGPSASSPAPASTAPFRTRGGSFPPPDGRFPPPMGWNGPPGPPPDGMGPPPGAPGTPPLPAGFHLVHDPAGFSVVLPGGYVRDPEPPDIFYWSADHSFRFGESSGRPDPHGAYAALHRRHLAGPKTYVAYRDGVVTTTEEHGQQAALWEFTYDHAGARRAFELCWTENGRMYEISLSAPIAHVEQARSAFDTARATFRAG